MVEGQTPSTDRLTFCEADLLSDAGWTEATDGADYVLHMASPMSVGQYRRTDLVAPRSTAPAGCSPRRAPRMSAVWWSPPQWRRPSR